MPVTKDQVVDSIEAFFAEVEDNIVSRVQTQALPLIGTLDSLPRVGALVDAFESIRTAVLEALDPVAELVDAINDLALDGVSVRIRGTA